MAVLYLPFVPAAEQWSGLAPDELDQVPSAFALFQQPMLVLRQQLARTNRVKKNEELYEPRSLSYSCKLTNARKAWISRNTVVPQKVN